MKKSSEKTFTLLFNKHEAVYEENEELEKPSAPSGGFSVSISMTGGGKKYMNTKEKISLEEDEVFEKEFLFQFQMKSYNKIKINNSIYRKSDETICQSQ